MTAEEALETLLAMANVQDGYAKKATDPGLKLIHKANAKAQREVAALVGALHDNRARLAAELAEARKQVEALLAAIDNFIPTKKGGLRLRAVADEIRAALAAAEGGKA